jgi:hypothetical protein
MGSGGGVVCVCGCVVLMVSVLSLLLLLLKLLSLFSSLFFFFFLFFRGQRRCLLLRNVKWQRAHQAVVLVSGVGVGSYLIIIFNCVYLW